MNEIYIDSDFKCHTVNDGTMTAVETDFFEGKCDTFIEGCRFVPSGKSWTRSDGEVWEAADIYTKGVSQSRVEAELDKIDGVRYHYPIKSSSNVHFDVPKGNR